MRLGGPAAAQRETTDQVRGSGGGGASVPPPGPPAGGLPKLPWPCLRRYRSGGGKSPNQLTVSELRQFVTQLHALPCVLTQTPLLKVPAGVRESAERQPVFCGRVPSARSPTGVFGDALPGVPACVHRGGRGSARGGEHWGLQARKATTSSSSRWA